MGHRDQTPLIGRTRELALAGERLAAARRGEGGVLIVSGEAGIGKSRLVREIGMLAQTQGFQVLIGACFETDQTLPYGPFLDLLRTWISEQPDDHLPLAIGRRAADLVSLLPELAAWLPDRTPSTILTPEAERVRLFQAVATMFGEVAALRPIMIVLEDLHWSDAISVQMVRFLARRLVRWPVLLVVTARTDEPSAAPASLIADLERERQADVMPVESLSPGDAAVMIRSITAARLARASDRETLVALTGGNPFFIEELVGTLASRSDRIPLTDMLPVIPPTIQDAVRRRVDRLSEGVRRTLGIEAVAGQRVDTNLLADLAEQPEAVLLGQIRDLIGAQFVEEHSADLLVFRHDLIR